MLVLRPLEFNQGIDQELQEFGPSSLLSSGKAGTHLTLSNYLFDSWDSSTGFPTMQPQSLQTSTIRSIL
jgi:hypothetical protein